MRAMLLFLAFITVMSAAELEKITTTDNRVLIGYYDESAEILTLDGKVSGSVSLKKSQIASRVAYIKPNSTDALERLKDEERKANIDRESALSQAGKFRALAAKDTGPQGAIAQANAEGATKEAARLEKVITELRQKITEVEKERLAAQKATTVEKSQPEKPAEDELGAYEKIPADVAAAIAKAEALRDQAAEIQTKAFLAWMKQRPPTALPIPPLSDDPRKSEFAARRAVTEENHTRERLRQLLEDAERAKNAQAYRNVSSRLDWILGEIEKAKRQQ